MPKVCFLRICFGLFRNYRTPCSGVSGMRYRLDRAVHYRRPWLWIAIELQAIHAIWYSRGCKFDSTFDDVDLRVEDVSVGSLCNAMVTVTAANNCSQRFPVFSMWISNCQKTTCKH